MGNIYECEVTYQGYSCLRAEYRRTEGLSPEPGFVEILLSDLGSISLDVPAIPWRAVTGFEHDCGEDPYNYFNSKATTTRGRAPSTEPGGGLNLYGQLMFTTYSYPGGAIIDRIVYEDIYVDVGMEETLDNINNEDHTKGVVHVPLTDIRQFYADNGIIYGRMNCRNKDGSWDIGSIKQDGKPYNVTEVLEWLFSQLPGSPPVHSASEFRTMAIDPPQGIEGRGEPAVETIQKVLDRLGLKAQMLPDGQFMVNAKHSVTPQSTLYREAGRMWNIKTGAVGAAASVTSGMAGVVAGMGGLAGAGAAAGAAAVGASESTSSVIVQAERKTETATKRPAAVCVCGPKRVQRVSFHCVPVLPDTDGRYYRIEEVAKRHGYSMAEANRQIFVEPLHQFEDVPPTLNSIAERRTPEGGVIENLHEDRKAIWKNAYKLYLPVFMFSDDRQGVSLKQEFLVNIPFLPMVPAAWYPSEIDKSYASEVPNSLGAGDYEDFPQLLPPVVRGDRLGRAYFHSALAMQRNYERLKKNLESDKKNAQNLLNMYKANSTSEMEALLKSNEESAATLDAILSGRYGVGKMPSSTLAGDVGKAISSLGSVMDEATRLMSVRHDPHAAEYFKIWKKGAEDIPKSIIQPIEKQLAALDEYWRKLWEMYKDKHGIPCRYNLGQTVIPPGLVSVDKDTGLIKASMPLCRVSHPVFFDGDHIEVIGDGGVVITFGYELPGGKINAYTNFVFFADDGGDSTKRAEIKFAGCHRSTPIKCPMIPMESREYIDEQGLPCNQNACYAEAKCKAAPILEQPAKIPGWAYELIGLRKVVLDRGTNSVQHVFDGETGVGMTSVAVNDPGSRLALLQANAIPKVKVYESKARDVLQREGS